MTRASELLALPASVRKAPAKLNPFVTALPVGTRINVCTAFRHVLDSLSEEIRISASIPRRWPTAAGRLFPDAGGPRGPLGAATYDKFKNSVAESSDYFRATVWVTIGTTEFTLYSLLARGGTGRCGRPAQFRYRISPRSDV